MLAPSFITNLSTKKQSLLAIGMGAFSTLAMPPVFFWPILFITLSFLMWLIDANVFHPDKNQKYPLLIRCKKAALIGWGFGFGYFFVSLYWIGSSFLVEFDKFGWALPFAITLLPAGLALFYSAAFALCAALWVRGPERLIIFASVIYALDWLRGHILTGFPWNLMGHALTGNEAMMQSVSVFGIYGLSAIACLIFASPATVFKANQSKDAGTISLKNWSQNTPLILAMASLLGLYCFGQIRLNQSGPTKFIEDIDLVLVQPNVPQKDKVNPERRSHAFQKVLKLTNDHLLAQSESVTTRNNKRLIIWPETAIPFVLSTSSPIIDKLKTLLGPTDQLITGAFRIEKSKQQEAQQASQIKIFNALFVVNDQGEITSHYDKHHLVPFGEYLPFPKLLSTIGFKTLVQLRGGFEPGPTPTPVSVNSAPPFLPFICYEAIFPLQMNKTNQTAKWLLNISNDGWFGHTVGPYQHAHMVRLRTIETGLPMVRVVNGGITVVFDGLGRKVIESKLGKTQVLTTKLPNSIAPGTGGQLGNLWTIIALMASFILVSTMKNFDKFL